MVSIEEQERQVEEETAAIETMMEEMFEKAEVAKLSFEELTERWNLLYEERRGRADKTE